MNLSILENKKSLELKGIIDNLSRQLQNLERRIGV